MRKTAAGTTTVAETLQLEDNAGRVAHATLDIQRGVLVLEIPISSGYDAPKSTVLFKSHAVPRRVGFNTAPNLAVSCQVLLYKEDAMTSSEPKKPLAAVVFTAATNQKK